MISSTLNLGDKLISYSNSSNSIFYPYLITSTTNNTKSNRRILQNSQQDSQSKQNVTLSLSSFTVQFPAEVIYSSSKQVITAQQWTKDPRQAPFAISQTVSLQIQQNGKEVNVKDTSQPIIIVLPKIIPSPISEDTSSISCSFYDEDTNSFQNEGCTFVKETILNIVCSCTHLTDFTAQKIQNQSKKNQVDLGSLVKTMNQEQQKLSNLNQKVVITSLPTLSIGQRQISLVSQLQVIQSGGINQFLKKNMIVLKEDPDYIDDNFDILQQDFISLYYDQEVNQSQNVGQFQINKLEALFYMLTVFVIIFHISMRACLRLGSTKLSQLQLSLIKEIQKQIQKLLNNELKRIKVQKQKFEKAKVIQKKFDMSKFKFTLQEQRASIKTGNQKTCEQNIIKTQKKESVIRFQDQEQEILTQSPPLILLELEQKFSPQGMKLEADISQDKNQHFENQMSLFQKKQDDQETMLSDKDSFPSFSKSQSPMVYDYSKSPIQNSTTYKRSIFSRNQVTYMKFNQIESQFMLTQQDDCVDDNQYYDTKCTDGNLITESNLLISNRQDKVQNKNQEYLFFRDDSHNKNQTTDYIKQNNLLQQLTQFDDDDDNDKEEEKTDIKEEKKTLEQFTPKNIMLQINKQKNMVASREIRNQQYKSNFLELFYQKPAKQNIYQTLSDSKNCLDTNSFQQFTFTEQSDSIFETSNLNTSHTQSMNQINEIQMFQSEKNSNLNNQKEFQLTPIQKNKKSIKKTVKQFKVDENYQNVIKNQRQKLTNPRYKSMKNYLQTKNLLENIKENNKFLQDAKKKSQKRRQTKVENLSKFQKEIDDKKRISVIAQFSQNFYFLKNEKIKSSKAFKFIQSVWKKKLISQSLENLLEIKKLINILKNSENINPLNSVVNTQRRQLLAYLYGYLSHECQNGEHVLQNYQKEYESDFQPSQMEENQLLKQKLQSLKQQIKNFVKNNKKTDQRNMEQFDNYKRQDLIGNDHFVQLFKKYSYNKIDYVLDEDNLLEFLKQQINMKISLVKIIDFALDSQLNITKFDIIQLFSLFRQQSRIYSSQFTKCLLFCTQVVITATVNVLLIPYTSNQDVDLTKVSITYSNPRVFISLILGYLISYFSFGCLTGIFAKSTKCLETINLNQIYISQKIFQLLYLLIGLFQIGFSLKYLYSIKDDQKIQHQFEFSSFFIEIIASILLSNALIDGLLYIYYILIAKHKYEDETQSRFLFILACRGYYYFKGFDNIKIHELLLIKDAIPQNLRN